MSETLSKSSQGIAKFLAPFQRPVAPYELKVVGGFTEKQIARAIRQGVLKERHDGDLVLVMTEQGRAGERQLRLERLYAARDQKLGDVTRLQDALSIAEDELLEIKRQIGNLHRANGARG